jgi:transaldolase
MPNLDSLSVKIYADGAEKAGMLALYRNPLIRGFTTNPTLMRKAGIGNYETFARDILASISDRPISFEVFSDEFDEMEKQALRIASWGENVFVKIPVTNTRRESSSQLIGRLSASGVRLNITAMLTLAQVQEICPYLLPGIPTYISILAGRIADTGCDPIPVMQSAVDYLRQYPDLELIWASPRELLNIFQANSVGCHIITVPHEMLKKLTLVGKDLEDYSLETVKMFRSDAVEAGYSLE